jgi:hypothetical protein
MIFALGLNSYPLIFDFVQAVEAVKQNFVSILESLYFFSAGMMRSIGVAMLILRCRGSGGSS